MIYNIALTSIVKIEEEILKLKIWLKLQYGNFSKKVMKDEKAWYYGKEERPHINITKRQFEKFI